MPKQIFKIDRFEKGILSAFDSKDIPVGGLVTAKGCDLGTIGIVRLTPKADTAENALLTAGTTGEYLIDTDYALMPGSGFFIFPSDYTRPASNGVAVEEETEFYVYTYGPNFFIYDILSGVWDGNATAFNLSEQSIQLGTDSSTNAIVKPVFYYGAGALRVTDGNYTHLNNDDGFKGRWFGHIRRSLFPDATTSSTEDKLVNHNRWHVDTQELLPPVGGTTNYYEGWTKSQGSTVAGVVAFNSAGGTVGAPSGDNFIKIWIDSASNADGTWDINQSNYKFYLSYIYDGSQESPVTELGSLATHATDQESIFAGVTIAYTSGSDGTSSEIPDTHWRVNPRITAARLYYSDPVDGEGTKYLLLDIDFIKGCKKADELDYTIWNETIAYRNFECPTGIDGTAITATTTGFEFEDPPKTLTYEILNGYSAEEVTSAKYKAATIFNNRCYIGNVMQVANVGDSYNTLTPVFADRIIRTPINFEGNPQFDTFPSTHKMDIAVSDGDDIIALEGYSDRLLVFKKKSVYIVNVAQDGQENIESHLPYIGVNNACQVVRFEKGVAWANPSGCYLYNGEQTINLTENKIYSGGKWEPSHNSSWSGGSLSQSWQLDPTHIPAITYLFSKKQLWVTISVNGDSQSNDAWVYDFKTEGWSMATASIGTNTRHRSNIMVDSSGIPKFLQYDDTVSSEKLEVYTLKNIPATNSEFKLVTPDIDFAAPGVRKKIYKVYVSFKTDEPNSNVKVNYSVNGSPEFDKTFKDGNNFVSNDLNTTSNEDFSTNINEGEGVFDLSGTNQSVTNNATVTVSNNTARITNNSTTQGYARYDLGTLEARNYNFNLYFKPVFSSVSRKENVKSSQGVISIGTSNSDPGTNRIVHQIIGQEGAYKFNFKATAAAHYLYIQNQSSVNGDFIEVSNISNTEEPDYYIAELKPTTSSEANNIYSFQLKFEADGAVPKGFEIGDISIVYRMKNVK